VKLGGHFAILRDALETKESEVARILCLLVTGRDTSHLKAQHVSGQARSRAALVILLEACD
jgi:hypothetical protein